jgi:DNA-3-methyladenine glycosylase II
LTREFTLITFHIENLSSHRSGQVKVVKLVMRPIPPFRLGLTAWALRRRPENIVDRWDGTTYRRVLLAGGRPMEVAVRQGGSAASPRLLVEARGEKLPDRAEEAIAGSLELLLGTNSDLEPFYAFAARHPRLHALARRFIGFKPPRFESVFEALCNGIVCQQITLRFGMQLLNRLALGWGEGFQSAGETVHAFPLPAKISRVDETSLRKLGLSFNKARALIECARKCTEEKLDRELLSRMDDKTALDILDELHGVGTWTAEYVLLRGLGRLHIFPASDSGARNGLRRWLRLRSPPDPQRARRLLARWQPFAGLIYFHLLLDRLEGQGYLG